MLEKTKISGLVSASSALERNTKKFIPLSRIAKLWLKPSFGKANDRVEFKTPDGMTYYTNETIENILKDANKLNIPFAQAVSLKDRKICLIGLRHARLDEENQFSTSVTLPEMPEKQSYQLHEGKKQMTKQTFHNMTREL